MNPVRRTAAEKSSELRELPPRLRATRGVAAIPDTTSGLQRQDDHVVLSCGRQRFGEAPPSASAAPPARPPVHSLLQGPADAEKIWRHATGLPAKDAIHWLMTMSFEAERAGDALGVARLRRMRRTVQQARLEQLTVIDLLTSDTGDEVFCSALRSTPEAPLDAAAAIRARLCGPLGWSLFADTQQEPASARHN